MYLHDSNLTRVYRGFVTLAIISSLIAIFLMFDLALHPFESNLYGLPYWHRWLFGIPLPIANMIIGFLCIRRAKGNIIGPILVMYGAGIAGEGIRFSFPQDYIPLFLIFGGAFAWFGFFFITLLFPTGSFYPPRSGKIITLSFILIILVFIFWIFGAPTFSLGSNNRLVANSMYTPMIEPLYNLTFRPTISFQTPVLLIWMPVSLFLRYRAGTIQLKQQMKWMLFGVLLGTLTQVISLILSRFDIQFQ